MPQITNAAESSTRIRHNLRQLAHQTGDDVEGVVAWLASSATPEEAMGRLLR
jgi:hypothetical protein